MIDKGGTKIVWFDTYKEAHSYAARILMILSKFSDDYEMFDHESVFRVYRMFEPTRDGSGSYRELIAAIGYRSGGHD